MNKVIRKDRNPESDHAVHWEHTEQVVRDLEDFIEGPELSGLTFKEASGIVLASRSSSHAKKTAACSPHKINVVADAALD